MEITINCTKEKDGYDCVCVSGTEEQIAATVATYVLDGWELADQSEFLGTVFVYFAK